MMDIHNHFVDAVVEELARLNGTDFEYLCRYVMEILTDTVIILKGHNLYQKPVGYSVDLIKDSKTVGQCGSDANYYTDGKPLSDIDGCIKNSPGCRHIYLFGNKRAKGNELQELNHEINVRYNRYAVELYDSQRIGEAVYNNMFKTSLVESILRYLPKANRYYLLMPQTNNVPMLSLNYVSRPEEKELIQILKEKGFLQVYGLSGIGKSQLAMAVANQVCDEYHTILWYDGKRTDGHDLSAVYTQRLGENINLKTVLGQFRILLVVDNLNDGVNEFKEHFEIANKKGSCCIITSLQKNIDTEHSFQLSYTDREISKQILCQALVKPTKEQLEKILNQISGYPLLLDLARRTVENGNFTWEELVEISNLTGIPDDERNVAFAERIVGRFKSNYSELFNAIIMLKGLRISNSFLMNIDIIKAKNLVHCAVLQSNEEYSYQIHQVVFDAIQNVMGTELYEDAFRHRLIEFLEKHVVFRDASLYSFMTIHRDACLEMAGRLSSDDKLRHYIVLAIIYTMDTYQEHDKYIKLIDELSLEISGNEIDLNLYIEKIEIIQNQKYLNSRKDDTIRMKVVELDIESIEKIPVRTDKQKALICHHVGKWFMSIRKEKEAEEYLKKALSLNQSSYSSMLQLTRLYNRQKRIDDVRRMVGCILEEQKIKEVPVSVLLSTYGLLSSSKYAELCEIYLDQHIDSFISTVYASLSVGYTHTYLELAKLSSHLAYNHPEVYNQLCSKLPLPLDIEKDERLKENYGNIISAQFRFCDNEEDYRKKIFEKAEMYLLMNIRDNDFKRKALLDLYIAGREVDKALAEASTYDNKEDIYLHQGLSKIYCIKKDYGEALKHIEYAIMNEGDAYVGHRAAFRHDKALCLLGQGNNSYGDVMAEAIELQPNEKVKKQWMEELSTWGI